MEAPWLTPTFRTQPSAGKVMATVFWDSKGIILIYYISNNELPIFLCERKPGNRSPVNYFISSNGLFSRAN